jgi:hypothetical protein
MKALVYLLGSRALDVARDSQASRRPIPELLPGPIATTEERASAWRRWSQSVDGSFGEPRPIRRPTPASRQPSRTPG